MGDEEIGVGRKAVAVEHSTRWFPVRADMPVERARLTWTSEGVDVSETASWPRYRRW